MRFNLYIFGIWCIFIDHKHDVLANANAFQYVMKLNRNYTNTLENWVCIRCYAYTICSWHSLLPFIIWMHFIALQKYSFFVMFYSISISKSINKSINKSIILIIIIIIMCYIYIALFWVLKTLYMEGGGISSSTTSVQHPPGWYNGSHSAPEHQLTGGEETVMKLISRYGDD